MTLRGGIVLLVIALIAAATWWAQHRVQAPGGLTGEPEPSRPDYYMDDFRILVTDENGRARYELAGKRIAHLPDDDSGELQAPELVFHGEDSTPWTVKAAAGWVASGGDEVQLHGDVQVSRPETGTQAPVTVETESLAVRPQERTALTEDPVVITSPGARLTGTGLFADLNARRIELLANARGVYVP